MTPQEIIWIIGVGIVLAGEIWAIFSKKRGDTITENTFKHPVSMGLMGALLVWAIYHFFIAQGRSDWWDFLPIGIGAAVGVIVWYFNGKYRK